MSMRLRIVTCLALLAATSRGPGALAQEPSSKAGGEVVSLKDITYKKAGDAELKLDITAPKGGGPYPAVLVIHGGGWRAGNKKDCQIMMPDLARRGYVAVSPQYRFCPKETFPAQLDDVKEAVRWVKAHAKEYRVDPDRVGAMGFSAGGHLSLMLGLTGPSDGLEGPGAEGGADTKVVAVVNFFGPTDLAADDIPQGVRPMVKDLLGATPREKPELAARASPLTYVSKGDAAILTFQGTKDPLVPHTQATKLADAMTAAGVPGRVELLLGASHGWGEPDLTRTKEDTIAFFDRYLKGAGK
ncbi:Carboxylesterase NlhH [Aquisphaera giovannonii]|uniref:Carboxylesterase NlhH n=1 Tax=Aquisphaera giovannonii TaxID=406548 RepID=A0A5B9W4K5_9BACT|nr:alpha/beta hydrolase [Aquisphaera giovannonii]QEH35498.1 Carboxylesterase NlhH [Aquisphaera giovannonii]